MSNNAYISIRDDSGIRSLSNNERNFVRSCALSENNSSRVLRGDGRGPGDVRKVRLTLGRWHNGAECTVQWGTRVSALVTAELLPPSSERPSEGTVSLAVDLSPMASSSFGHAQPLTTTGTSGSGTGVNVSDETQKLLTNRILRCLERTLLIGGALDTEALCVQSGAWVWRLNVQVTVLDHGGNLMDASVLAAVAALRHYRKPQVDLATDATSNDRVATPKLVHSDAREPTPLPIHHTPLSITFALIHADDASLSTMSTSTVAALVDPTYREELVQTGTITIAMNVHSEVCLLDFGGGCELKPTQLKQCWKLAEDAILKLCKMLEETLKEADEKAHQDRLNRLVAASNAQQVTNNDDNIPVTEDDEEGIAYLAKQAPAQVDTTSEFKDVTSDVAKAAAQVQEEKEEEEAYRLKALDYSLGHVAAKVKENARDDSSGTRNISASKAQAMAGSLLAAMLQSAQGIASEPAMTTENGDGKTRNATQTSSTDDADQLSHTGTETKTNDVRSQEAIDEFEQFAKQKQKEAAVQSMEVDSDEEETTTMLQSEFQNNPAPPTTTKAASTNGPTPSNVEEDDVDDLAMAITNKKKKKKKKSKK